MFAYVNEQLVIDELSSALQYMAQGASTISTMEKLLHTVVTIYVEYHEENTSLYARSNSVSLLKEEILSDRADAIASQRGWIYEGDEEKKKNGKTQIALSAERGP